MSGYELDEAVSAIQGADSGISAVSKDIGDGRTTRDDSRSQRACEQRASSNGSSKKRMNE